MTRWWLGVAVGLAMGAVAYGEESQMTRLNEVAMKTVAGHPFQLPERYGHLVTAVISGEVEHLYFEDQAGNIRVVLIGPRGAVQRSRSSLELLSTDVFLLKRGRQPDGS